MIRSLILSLLLVAFSQKALASKETPTQIRPPNQASLLFYRAVENGNFDMMRLYLNKGANINCDNCFQGVGGEYHPSAHYTPLMYTALSRERASIFKFLIENGAAINFQNSKGVTALMLASDGWNIEKIKILVESGADVRLKDKRGEDALTYLLRGFLVFGNEYERSFRDQNLNSMVEYMLNNGASINNQNHEGLSPLMLVSADCGGLYSPSLVATKLLLSLGANPNLKTKSGDTALMIVEKIAVQSPQGSTCNKVYAVLSDSNSYRTSNSANIKPSEITSKPTSTSTADNANYSMYSGNYSGNYSGDDNGTFRFTVGQDGSINLSGISSKTNQPFSGNGKINKDGSLGIPLGNISTGATFQGSINPKSGTLYGTWKNAELAGNFSGSKQVQEGSNPLESIGSLLDGLGKVLRQQR